MGEICLQCGDRGFVNAFVDCVKCLDAVIHLYCLDVIPENFDEDVEWNCDDCAIEAQNLDHDVVPLQNRGIDAKNVQESSKDGVEQSYEGPLLQLVRKEHAKGNWRKKRSVKKYKHRKDDSTLASKTKENEGPTLENRCAETNVQGRNHIENEESEDVEKNFLEDLGFSSPEPIVEPIWRGCFNIWNDKCDIIDGIIAHMSSKASGKVYEEATQFEIVLDLEMLPKSDVWLKSFETSQPTGDNIALYFFPSEISERIFDHLVEEMMHKELALKAFLKNTELLIFTSNELPILQWRVQGKYYLWGVFRSKQNIDQYPKTTTPTGLPSEGGAKTKRKRGRHLDDGWIHANPLDEPRQKSECRYCGFISTYGGISRLKAHLGGGHPLLQLQGCDNVSPEVKKVMANWFSEWVKTTKCLWSSKAKEAIANPRNKRGGTVDDDTREHHVQLTMENFGVSDENQRTGEIISFKKGHHILGETLDQITNTSLKDRLEKLIQGKCQST